MLGGLRCNPCLNMALKLCEWNYAFVQNDMIERPEIESRTKLGLSLLAQGLDFESTGIVGGKLFG